VRAAQASARVGDVAPEAVADLAVALLPDVATSMRAVLNATGIVVHTNLGRAPLSSAAVDALAAASGYVDVELDLTTGERALRGAGAITTLLGHVPEAERVLVVNNGAAALLLAPTALAAGREVVVSRGEMVEIGDGFRLPDLVASTGARLREVGTTNRSTRADYEAAVSDETGCVLKVHPSNFRVEGFTSAVAVEELATLGPPVVVDVGSGLLRPAPELPDEPDVQSALRAGAAVVTCSGDKLLGGPQAGLVLGRADVVDVLRRHPLYRALRCDKLTLAALEATLRGPQPPVWQAIRASGDSLRRRAERLAASVGGEVVATDGAVGGGGAPGVPLPGWGVALDEGVAARLRGHAVLARVSRGRTIVDLRCVPETEDARLERAVRACTS
jgi:L-seryl-tRNA(Ser) seleniumtransferase